LWFHGSNSLLICQAQGSGSSWRVSDPYIAVRVSEGEDKGYFVLFHSQEHSGSSWPWCSWMVTLS
jgi:hypothetical protein